MGGSNSVNSVDYGAEQRRQEAERQARENASQASSRSSGNWIEVEVYRKHSAMCNGVATYKSTNLLFKKDYPANYTIAAIQKDIRAKDAAATDGVSLISNFKIMKANQLVSEALIHEDAQNKVNLSMPPAPQPAPTPAPAAAPKTAKFEYAVTEGLGTFSS